MDAIQVSDRICSTVNDIVHHLALAYGGTSQFGVTEIAKAAVGQVNNNWPWWPEKDELELSSTIAFRSYMNIAESHEDVDVDETAVKEEIEKIVMSSWSYLRSQK